MLKRILSLFLGLFLILGIFFLSIVSDFLQDIFEVKKVNIPIEQSLRSDWVIKLSENIISTPLIRGNHLYAQTSKSIQSFDLQTHKMVWEAAVTGSNRNCPPEANTDTLFLVDKNGLIAFDMKNGNRLWRSQIDGKNLVFDDIEVGESRVFVATHNGYLYSLAIDDGRVIWKTPVEPRSTLRILLSGNNVTIDSSSSIVSYNQLSGEELWKEQIQFDGGLILKNQKTLIGLNYSDDTSRLIGIDLADGEMVFSKPIQVDQVNCIVETNKGILIAGRNLILYDLQADNIIWSNDQITNLGCPIVFAESVFVKKKLRDIYKYDILSGLLQSRLPIGWEDSSNSSYSVEPIVYNNWIIIETRLRRIEFMKQ